jgi:hypothetical protein
VISGFTGEGGKAFELVRRGSTWKDAWFQAARESQPSRNPGSAHGPYKPAPRWAAVLAAETSTVSALKDGLPKPGRPVPPIDMPTQLTAIWIPT